MSQPVKLADDLVLDARLAGAWLNRSIAGQIEFWARLGCALEPLLDGTRALALRKAGKARPLAACLESVRTREGERNLAGYLKTVPYPHYAAAPGRPGLIVRTEKGGRTTLGRFVGRRFKASRR
ncbi:MAG: hypothetical protein HYY93_01110 [Planctomycetes bacterium]|nr:hypothetical protein [Planctomycetota bacterium]